MSRSPSLSPSCSRWPAPGRHGARSPAARLGPDMDAEVVGCALVETEVGGGADPLRLLLLPSLQDGNGSSPAAAGSPASRRLWASPSPPASGRQVLPSSPAS
jgi:hypothetical protein